MKIKREEVLKYIDSMTYSEFKNVAIRYGENHGIEISEDLATINTMDLQKILQVLSINNKCPKCGSEHTVKNGSRKQIQRYKCKNCNTQFTLFTNTIMEKTKWNWHVWVRLVEMVLNNYSLAGIRHVLTKDLGCDGIDHKTVFLLKHKIVHALAQIPQPTLSGVVQVDETFIRESQKGSRNLVSYLSKDDVREPRYGRKPSKMGVMGPEFATVTTAIDNTGHCVCKVTGLGKLTPDVFTDMFEDSFNTPAYICSDANSVYRHFCKVFKISHYERPSNYIKELKANGYVEPTRRDKEKNRLQREANDKIRRKLYKEGLIDKLTNKGFVTYDEFKEVRELNNLNLARVNQLHADIKRFIYGDMTNVSTKYLEDYIGFFSYVRNWSVDNGNYPCSHKDAETVLIEILKAQGTYTVTDLKETELRLPKPSSRYITLLKAHTKEARRITDNEYFKFDEEDNVISFNRRQYLADIPESRLKLAFKHFRIRYKGSWVRWANISILLKDPRVNEIVMFLIKKDKSMQLYQEDIDYLAKEQYRNPDTA